ncbi:methionine--tRNA ligase [Phaeovibrio sulfidiphilus]|uniref:Methionine--tRNA ligase n=1 Tax=Phaeovibrio sulfidiphilus TaxID=1220600 RepID=A0A8J6YQT0_9PROT|nr:methionine--tRNA ligase [Phaeovibrio sulfidiphilus]MBE1237657.1 methionine--tRNA ligase [Phaeovibrio sulfidiphilus]
MSVSRPPFYVTTPIYYVNDKPHIGHAYTTLACDVLARFKRLDGFDVRFLTGTDEHGQKIEAAARAADMEPQAFTDRVSESFRSLLGIMNYTPDDFIRTTEPRHKTACQDLWNRLVERGDIYLGSYAGWYSTPDEAFVTETELVTGPDGVKRAPSGAVVEWVEEPSYFFRLSRWQEPLLEFYRTHPDFIAPESRRNEIIRFVEGGLTDLSVSRTTFSWGVPVPGDERHVMYVWMDALTNYITALGYPEQDGDYARYWPADIHMVGKDIVRFHAVYWPAFLLAADLEPPKRVFAHGWWTNEGEKISKRLGNIIDPVDLVNTYGLDAVRYFLMREVPFGNDGDFSHRAMVGRVNSELANDLGNLAQRSLSMIAKNCGGQVPQPLEFTPDDEVMLGAAQAMLSAVRAALDRQAFGEALETIWVVVRQANAYIDRQAPWVLRKTDTGRMGTVLYVLAETVRRIAILMQPFTPNAAARLLDQLACKDDARAFGALEPSVRLVPGTELPAPAGVFPRYVDPESAETK